MVGRQRKMWEPESIFLYACEPMTCADKIEPVGRKRLTTERKENH